MEKKRIKTEAEPGGRSRGGRRRKKNSLFSLRQYLIFFALAVFICSTNLALYASTVRAYGNDLQDKRVAGYLIVNLLFVSLLMSLIDGIRRKFTVEIPIRTIVETVDKISRGSFGIQVPPSYAERIHEYDEIIEGINKMSLELKSMETLKTDFVSNVSHEIKTPLAIIQNYAAILQSDGLTEEERLEYSRTIAEASGRLSVLVSNILKLNRLENQEIFPENIPVNVGEQLRRVLLTYEDAWNKKNLEVEADIEDAVICCDENLLEIVWSNLISNAVKFTGEGGRIGVSLKEKPAFIEVTVRDNGCGMDETTGRHIFDKFYQGDTSHSREGNGLGLAMVKRVADILQGEIVVESRLGEGSTFTVRFKKGERR